MGGPLTTGLCTGPDLGFDGTGSLRVTSTRQMPLPPAIAPGSGWTNGLRMDASNGLWAAQCAPTPVSAQATSTTTVPVPGGTLRSFSVPAFDLPNPSGLQPAAFLGDVQFDALVYTNSSGWAELWGSLAYTPYPGAAGYASPFGPVDSVSPGHPITQAQAAAGTLSFTWRPQAKLGLGLWYEAGASPTVAVDFGVKNVTDNTPSTPLPLQVVSWTVTLTGTVWLIDTGAVT
jgi:hypothetical protein